MLFNSLHFVAFFPLVVVAYFLLPHKYRWILLLAASYYFYACWKVEYLGLIIFSTAVDYYAALEMSKHKSKKKRRKYLYISLLANFSLLFAFKYFNFVSENLRQVFQYFNLFYEVPAFQVLLPVGISFYTFQSVSYTIDVYRQRLVPEKNFGRFALYVSFFPQLVAGPIERASRLLPQFYAKQVFDYKRVSFGLKLMFWGFFKKLVIADNLAEYVNAVFGNPTYFHGISVMFAGTFFAFQVYCDFSGYADIAVGASKVLGINLIDNFRQPFLATSMSSLWRRWHISLTSWFKDYIYIPLGGSRVSKWKWYANILIVFIISGIWHGAAWTFILFGTLQGLYLIFEIATRRYFNAFYKIPLIARFPVLLLNLRRLAVFALFAFSMLFFRADSISDALILTANLFKISLSHASVGFGGKLTLLINFTLIALLLYADSINEKGNLINRISEKPVLVRWGIYYIMALIVLVYGNFGLKEFIYFQF